jgi:hypothetical protein
VDVKQRLWRRSAAALLVLLVHAPHPAGAFSVLSHEAIIDGVWKTDLEPMIRARQPGISDEALAEAHAYAYGGSLIQDLGYYPFGSKLFTDLAHYVRSGDFVEAMLRESKDINEYAFALGALAHLVADTVGHPVATNRAVPLLYPKLERKFGADVTYEEDPAAHVKTEFGFDVVQVAKGHFGPEAYRDFIGFKVAKRLLASAFSDTYGLPMSEVFASEDLAIGSYRRAVSTVIPEMTKVAWDLKEKDIVAAAPGATRDKFVQIISRASYEREWGTEYERPGILARVLAVLFRLLPKVGPFKALGFKAPTAEVEHLYMEGFNRTVDAYRTHLRRLRSGTLDLKERDLDTGRATRAGEYALADRTFSELLHRLAKRRFDGASPALRATILDFFAGVGGAKVARGRNAERTMADLQALRGEARRR